MNYAALLAEVSHLVGRFGEQVRVLVPRLIGALALLGVGIALGYLLRFGARRLIGGLDRLVPNQRLQRTLRRLGMQRPAADVIGGILFWTVVLFVLTAATETLGLPVITTWLSGVALYLPRILSAVLICLAGLLGGVLVRDLTMSVVDSAGLTYGLALGRLVQTAVVLVAVAVAVEQVGIDIHFLTTASVVTLGGLLFGAALAFGLGARTTVSNILASHYLRRVYTVGQTVRIGDLKGEIVQITATAVILRSAEGRALVPAKVFNETVSVLVVRES